jgi:hypothetical protein
MTAVAQAQPTAAATQATGSQDQADQRKAVYQLDRSLARHHAQGATAGHAVAAQQPTDALEQLRRGERASLEQPTSDTAMQAGLAQERYHSTWRYGDTPTPAPAEPSGQPDWLVLGAWGAGRGPGAVHGAGRASRQPPTAGCEPARRPDQAHRHAVRWGCPRPPGSPIGSPQAIAYMGATTRTGTHPAADQRRAGPGHGPRDASPDDQQGQLHPASAATGQPQETTTPRPPLGGAAPTAKPIYTHPILQP